MITKAKNGKKEGNALPSIINNQSFLDTTAAMTNSDKLKRISGAHLSIDVKRQSILDKLHGATLENS